MKIHRWKSFNESTKTTGKKVNEAAQVEAPVNIGNLNDAEEAIDSGEFEEAIDILRSIKNSNEDIVKDPEYIKLLKKLHGAQVQAQG